MGTGSAEQGQPAWLGALYKGFLSLFLGSKLVLTLLTSALKIGRVAELQFENFALGGSALQRLSLSISLVKNWF